MGWYKRERHRDLVGGHHLVKYFGTTGLRDFYLREKLPRKQRSFRIRIKNVVKVSFKARFRRKKSSRNLTSEGKVPSEILGQ